MLQALRKSTNTLTMKIILSLLALTFVLFFGTGGNFSGGGDVNSVVEIGDIEVSIHQVSREFNQQVQRAAPLLGGRLDPARAVQIGLLDIAIQTIIQRTLLDLGAGDLGLVASDDLVAASVRQLPQFQNAGQRFDRTAFEFFLRQSSRSEGQFLGELGRDITRDQYLGTVAQASVAPRSLVDAMLRYQGERRTAKFVLIDAGSMSGADAPDEAAIAAYYQANREAFRAPEYRQATLVAITPEGLAAEIDIDDETVAEAYEARVHNYTTPERRTVDQALFDDRAAADRVRDMIDKGRSFDDAVTAVTNSPPVSLGAVARADILAPELAEAAFALDAGAVSEPVQTLLGWHLLTVRDVAAATQSPLAEVRDAIRAELALEEAREEIFDVLNAVEDALAGGATLEEAGRLLNLAIRTIDAIARDGTDRAATPVDGLDSDNLVVENAFATEAGDISDVVETTDGGFFVLRVDRVIEAAIRPLNEVRQQVIEASQFDRRLAAAEQRARDIADRVAGGVGLTVAAATAGATVRATEPFGRTGTDANLPRALVTRLFEAKIGEVVATPVEGGAAVGELTGIEQADTPQEARDRFRAAVGAAMANDLQRQLAAALETNYSVDIDQESLRDAFPAR